MTLSEVIDGMFGKSASSPAQRAVNAGAPDAEKDPSDAKKRAGNYRKVHLNIDGFRVSIENPKGSVRSGVSPDGVRWSNTLACDYGDIRGTESVDGDPVDIYLSDHPEKGAVFVIDQIDPKTKKFDEHKVMYGFDSVEDAKKTYLACYQKGWGGLGWITPVSKAEFRKWIDSSTRKTKPFHEYASVTPIVDTIKVKAAQDKDDRGIGNQASGELAGQMESWNRNGDYDYVLEKDGYVSGGKAKGEFDSIVKAFKDKYGIDLSHMRMKWSKHPRYVSGKVSREIADDETVGSHGGDSVIYINPNLRSVMDRLGIKGKVNDLRRWSIAHELAHEIQANYSDAYNPDFVKRMVAEAKKSKFHTMYTDMVPEEKFDKELFAEYMAKLLTDNGNLNVEKTAQVNQDDPMEGIPQGVKLRSFTDAPATRTAIMDNMLEAVKNRFPIEDDDVRLELTDVKYEGPTSYTPSWLQHSRNLAPYRQEDGEGA